MPRHLSAALIVTLLGASTAARAQMDFVGARALGMGEAMRAIASGGQGPLMNPAAMSLQRQYVVEGIYGFRVEDLGHHANVSVVDSITSRVAAGLFYSFVYTEPKLGFSWAGGVVDKASLTRTGHAAGLSLSMALGDRFMIGVTTKYLHFDTTAPLPAGTTPSSLTLDRVNGVTWDVALLVRAGDKFNITAITYNLWDHGSRESPLSLGIGLAYVPLPILSITFDTVVNFTGYRERVEDPKDPSKVKIEDRITARLGPGIEFLAGRKVPIRAGVVYDTAWLHPPNSGSSNGATYLTLGVGYLAPQFGIDLGYRVKVDAGLENFLMLGVRLFVN